MDECFGYIIGIVLIIVAGYFFVKYVVIPYIIPLVASCATGIVAGCLLIGLLTGLWNTSYNYIEAIHDAKVMKREN